MALKEIRDALPFYTGNGVCQCGENVGRNPDDIRKHSFDHIRDAIRAALASVDGEQVAEELGMVRFDHALFLCPGVDDRAVEESCTCDGSTFAPCRSCRVTWERVRDGGRQRW